ncbi:MAG: hypothetical protein WBA23_13275 [Tunicatimonas sp.]|uniref:hypothetical protein n=1 Tax=Tunicatimonas sp. TaxID=1940096 RepID=UPI003C755B83
MVNLDVTIPTKFRLLPNKRIKRAVPENWAEVTVKQFFGYLKALKLGRTATEVRLLTARYLLPLPWYLFYTLNRVQLAQITYELRWMNQLPLTISMFKTINGFVGPGDSFSTLTIGEFAAASAYYDQYRGTHNPELLDYLIAVLYRPDRTKRFSAEAMESYLPKLRKVHPDIKLGVYLYLGGCLSELANRYPRLFSGPGLARPDGSRGGGRPRDPARPDGDPPKADGETRRGTAGRQSAKTDWLDFMRHLPSEKFGTLEQIEQSGLHAVLEVAHRMMNDSQKQKGGMPPTRSHAARRIH